ncbi:MAG: copper resistance protein CopC, partial [Gemmatimonadetes bacterium]|nr:copper resistance protein CopC [Gemmatimonadota bacterium]
TLPPGTYTVSWRGMGQDGHVVRDSFQFSVAAR